MREFKTLEAALDFAIVQETKAFTFYQDLAQRSQKTQTRKILEGLAAEELEHRIRLENVKKGAIELTLDPEVGSLNIAETLEELEPSPDMDYPTLLKVAMRKELLAYRTYLDLSIWTKDEKLKAIFKALAHEEAEHKLRLEVEYDLITF
ncbi:ferritin family protein [Planctomycetota bacterium]